MLLSSSSQVHEPTTYSDASKHTERVEAMQEEIKAPELNNTWSLETIPAGKHCIGRKWVYRVKKNPDGTVH